MNTEKTHIMLRQASRMAIALSCGLFASIAPLSFSSAQAQSAEDDGATQADTIVVQAQRRAENLQDVPIAVTAFDADAIENKQITEALDLVQLVPNFTGSNNTGLGSANVYYIRGLGNTESIATFDPPVGTYVDDIYLARQNANNTSFFDVEQIEVLRGPQGTLFGRNTTGGAVSIRMRKPQEEFGGFGEVSYGSFNRVVVRGAVDLPVSDNLLTKFSGFYITDDGYVDAVATGETLNGQEGFGVRGDIRLFLGEQITWDLGVEYSEDSGENILNYDAASSPLGSLSPLPLTSDGSNRISNTGLSTEEGEGTLLDQLLAGQGLGVDNETFAVTSNLAWEINSDSQINLIVGYRELDQDFIVDFFDGGLGGENFSTGGFAIANEGQHDQVSVELKYDGSFFDGAVDVIAGLFYFHEDNVTDFADVFTINVATPPDVAGFPILLADRVLENQLDSYAAYAQGDWHITDSLTFTAGLRWTQEEKDIAYSDNRDPATVAGGPTALLTSENLAANGIPLQQTESLITPRFVLEYTPIDNINFYASYTQGFKSGGWNARGTSPDVIVPFIREIAESYELGLRSTFFNNRVRFNATGFFTDVEDIQTPSAFVAADGSISFLTQNFSDFENLGLELEFNWLVTDALTVDASLGLQDAKFNNPGDSIVQQVDDCIASPTNEGGGMGIVTPDCSLSDPVRTPDVSLNIGANYRFDFPSLGMGLTPSGTFRYVTSNFTGTSNLPNSLEDGYALFNFGATLDFYNSNLKAIFECRNCTDTAFIASNLPPTVYFNEPRRIGGRIRYDF